MECCYCGSTNTEIYQRGQYPNHWYENYCNNCRHKETIPEAVAKFFRERKTYYDR